MNGDTGVRQVDTTTPSEVRRGAMVGKREGKREVMTREAEDAEKVAYAEAKGRMRLLEGREAGGIGRARVADWTTVAYDRCDHGWSPWYAAGCEL